MSAICPEYLECESILLEQQQRASEIKTWASETTGAALHNSKRQDAGNSWKSIEVNRGLATCLARPLFLSLSDRLHGIRMFDTTNVAHTNGMQCSSDADSEMDRRKLEHSAARRRRKRMAPALPHRPS